MIIMEAERYFWPEIAGLSNFKAMLDWEEKQRMNDALDKKLAGWISASKEAIRQAYRQGATDSRDITPEAIDEAYKRGFEDGNAGVLNAKKKVWELAKKLVLPRSKGGWEGYMIKRIFGEQMTEYGVLETYSVEEALTKFDEWEEKNLKNFDEFAKNYTDSIPIADVRNWLETRQ